MSKDTKAQTVAMGLPWVPEEGPGGQALAWKKPGQQAMKQQSCACEKLPLCHQAKSSLENEQCLQDLEVGGQSISPWVLPYQLHGMLRVSPFFLLRPVKKSLELGITN